MNAWEALGALIAGGLAVLAIVIIACLVLLVIAGTLKAMKAPRR
jgi:hypothetical protein